MSLDERRAKSTAWALTFADVVTLLLTFFVLLLVMLSDAEKRLSTLIEKLLDETYEEMTLGLSYDNIAVERETKGIKITITGNLFKSTSAEIDPKYYDVVHQIGQLIAESDLMNINSREEHKSLLKIIDQNNATLNVEVRCEGHTDDVPIPEDKKIKYKDNWELSSDRSLNVVKQMNRYASIDYEYFSALGYGPYRPIVSVETIKSKKTRREKDRLREYNRRVEIYLDAFSRDKIQMDEEQLIESLSGKKRKKTEVEPAEKS